MANSGDTISLQPLTMTFPPFNASNSRLLIFRRISSFSSSNFEPTLTNEAMPFNEDATNMNAHVGIIASTEQKIKIASQDLKRMWKMKQEKLSPRYTTSLHDIISVNV